MKRDPQSTPSKSHVFTKKALIIALASLAAGFVGTTTAATLSDQWYLGIGGTGAQLLPRTENTAVTRVDERGKGGTLYFGRDFDERSSGQIQLYSLGDVTFSDSSIASYTAADASLLYRFYDSRDNKLNAQFGVSFYGRFGFGFVERDYISELASEGSSPVYFGAGAGLETYFTNMLGVRSEVMYHEKDTISASLSLVARFGGRRSGLGYLPPTPIPSQSAPANYPAPDIAQNNSLPGTGVPPESLPPLPNGTLQNNSPNGSISSNSASNDGFEYPNSTSQLPEVAVMTDTSELRAPSSVPRAPQPSARPAPVASQTVSDSDNDGVLDGQDQCNQSPQNYPVTSTGCSLFTQLGNAIKFIDNSPLPMQGTELILQRLTTEMLQSPTTRIEITSHSDNAGDPQAKSALTRQRLRAIGIYLAQRGISQNRFLLRSFGGKRPAFDNNTLQGRQANNRIEIVEKP